MENNKMNNISNTNKAVRRTFTPENKMEIVLESYNNYTHGKVKLIAQKYKINTVLLSRWRTQLEESASIIYGKKRPFHNPVISNEVLKKMYDELMFKYLLLEPAEPFTFKKPSL